MSQIQWADLAISIPLDTSPYQIVDTMHLNKVDLVFRMLKVNQTYVTDSGQLVGVISRSSLRRFVAERVSCFGWLLLDLCLLF